MKLTIAGKPASKYRMLKIGLTGSIAVGKSFVCECFRELGCHVLDADKTAREVVEPGTEGLRQVIAEFGNGVLDPNGTLDRKKLGAIVFQNDETRQRLNSIIHPLVIEKQNEWLANLERVALGGIAIVDAALMIESGAYKRFDKLIVVWCAPDIQLSRLMNRDGLSRLEAEDRIAAQMAQDEKKSYADFLIDTSRGFEDTREQVVETFTSLRHLIS
ncbi:MAG TPA: dephospho-CoA kinase [Pyrinomonadaceae bacterium]|nr:dephospho-CoA kinase [Pyrinomonadaceae bacterium]